MNLEVNSMEFMGKLKDISKDWKSGKFNITFSMEYTPDVNEIEKLRDTELTVKAVKYRKKRSLDANALLWLCLGKIAVALESDKWDIYLQMLKRYGKYTYICVKPNMVESVKAQWRECEVIGEVDINGTKAIQMLCYFGSSTLNTKEFSVLLEGVISEMKEMGIEAPTSGEMLRAMEEGERMNGNEKRNSKG